MAIPVRNVLRERILTDGAELVYFSCSRSRTPALQYITWAGQVAAACQHELPGLET